MGSQLNLPGIETRRPCGFNTSKVGFGNTYGNTGLTNMHASAKINRNIARSTPWKSIFTITDSCRCRRDIYRAPGSHAVQKKRLTYVCTFNDPLTFPTRYFPCPFLYCLSWSHRLRLVSSLGFPHRTKPLSMLNHPKYPHKQKYLWSSRVPDILINIYNCKKESTQII